MRVRIIPVGFYYEIQVKEKLFWKTLYNGNLPIRVNYTEAMRIANHYKNK